MISRRDDTDVLNILQGGATKKSAIFELPPWGGAGLLICFVARRLCTLSTHHSSRLAYKQTYSRSIDENLNPVLLGLIKNGKELTPKLNNLFALLGSVSIVSWTSITFMDFFEFNFSYFVFAIIYVLLIAFVFLCLFLGRRIKITL